ncbi:MAG: putative Ig domain-containing protein, partial [Candidatus Poribacteria bacterium]
MNPPAFSYSAIPTVVQHTGFSFAPVYLNAVAGGADITFTWLASDGSVDVDGYALYWTDRPAQPEYPNRVAVGADLTHTLAGLDLGRSYSAVVVAYDSNGLESPFSEAVEVVLLAEEGANPPQLVSVPALEAVVEEPYTYSPVADDFDGDDITYSLDVGPEGAQIDDETGEITWTPTDDQEGSNSFAVTASDGTGEADEQTFSVVVSTVNHEPDVSFGLAAPTDPVQGAFTVYWSASDADDDPLTVDLLYSDDDGATLLDRASDLGSDGSFVWDTTTVADGTYRLAVRASDGDAVSLDLMDGSITIENAQTPWDPNGDGVVDIADLVTVARDFGTRAPGSAGDINGDGVVDIIDLVMVATHFGERTLALTPALPKRVPIDALSIRAVQDGDRLSVEVRSKGIPNLYGYQFAPTFDPTRLQLLATREVGYIDPDGPSFWRQVSHSQAPATVVATRLGHSVYQPGGLTTFDFRLLRPFRAGRATFGLRDVKLADRDGALISSSWEIWFPLGRVIVPTTTGLLPNYPNPFN